MEFETAEEEPFNPLRIQKRDGMPSHYTENCHGWHFGFLPQTWVDPDECDTDLGNQHLVKGGPLEVVVFGDRDLYTGSIVTVKILGAFAIADSRRSISWKILAVVANEQKFASLSSLVEIQEKLPGVLDNVQRWLLTSHGDWEDKGETFGPIWIFSTQFVSNFVGNPNCFFSFHFPRAIGPGSSKSS